MALPEINPLITWRAIRGLSQASLAEKAGLSLQGYQKIEWAQVEPYDVSKHKIAYALDLNIEQIIWPQK